MCRGAGHVNGMCLMIRACLDPLLKELVDANINNCRSRSCTGLMSDGSAAFTVITLCF